MFSAVVAFRTAKSARFTLKADVLAPVIDVRRHEAAQRKPSCSHLGHWGFAVPCSEIVSVRSNVAAHFLAVILIGRHDGAATKRLGLPKPIYVAQSSKRLARPQ
jgi:hypothetical protein